MITLQDDKQQANSKKINKKTKKSYPTTTTHIKNKKHRPKRTKEKSK